jgi:hypothetical protein
MNWITPSPVQKKPSFANLFAEVLTKVEASEGQ